MFTTLISQIAAVLLAVVCGLALWKGDRIERIAAVGVVFAWLAQEISSNADTGNAPLYAALAIELIMLVFFGVLSLFSVRTWPVAALLFHAIAIAAHVSYLFEVKISVVVYYAALTASAYGVLVALGVGAVGAWRERAALAQLPAVPQNG